MSSIAQITDGQKLLSQLRRVPLFAQLTEEEMLCIEDAEEWRATEREVFIEEGHRSEHFFVLLEGEISVSRRDGNQLTVVARYLPGAFFGEVPLLLGVPYILTGRAEADSRLIVFSEEGFWRLLRLCPSISGEIFRTMTGPGSQFGRFHAPARKARRPRNNVRRSRA